MHVAGVPITDHCDHGRQNAFAGEPSLQATPFSVDTRCRRGGPERKHADVLAAKFDDRAMADGDNISTV